ncbi:MAG: bL28 family ribosomal protein [Microgenomates group bacterium]
MAYICDNCGKGITFGRQSTHHRGIAGKRWKKRAQSTSRTFKPNIQKIGVIVAGQKISMKLCTSCIKRFKKDNKLASSASFKAA